MIERGGAEVGGTGGEAAFEFIAGRLRHALVVELAMGELQAPFDERPDFRGELAVAGGERPAGRAVGGHGGIAAVAGTGPDAAAFRDDRGRQYPVVRVDELRIHRV